MLAPNTRLTSLRSPTGAFFANPSTLKFKAKRFVHFLFFPCFFNNLCSVYIDDFLASGRGDLDQFPQLEFEQLPFSHPLFIMYSSGTTGAPKCMVHSAGV